MTEDRREAQASLYALGVLPTEEVLEFEAALRGDLKLQLLVGELSSAADLMVAAFPRLEPPPFLKRRVLSAIDRGVAGAASGAPLTTTGGAPGQSWVGWVVAAGFAGLCVLLLFLGQKFRL